ncbi:MAG: hypothetical protein COB37_02315 [Kordiimonadales bacterium]|nr:MAG: hypothetical protein COB37_02315 [Kordiimonadales bacterium]
MTDFLKSYQQQVYLRVKDPILWLLAVVTFIIAATNTATKLADAEKFGAPMLWQKAVLEEYSSFVSIILILPFLFALFDRIPLSRATWLRLIIPYTVLSGVFSTFHVSIMIGIRKIFWPGLFRGHYEFYSDAVLVNSFYEYRKDAITFLLLLLIAVLQRQLMQAKHAKKVTAEPIHLKSGGTSLLIYPQEFLYAKSASNYAEITSVSGEQLARITLAELTEALQKAGCDAVRIHRSFVVNRQAIVETRPIAGGDLSVKLRGGETLRASRRYKDQLNTKPKNLDGK